MRSKPLLLQNRTAAAMSEAMYKLHNKQYEFGPAAETLGRFHFNLSTIASALHCSIL